eukprot:m.237675 g.237675  ORF g.237675 m.237675 type:complete len:200 (-) comp21270_c0_seq1:27-626(-)
MAATGTANAITLKGSTEIVGEYLLFALNNILYQRGLYPHEMFARESKYDIPMMLTKDPALKDYLQTITTQLNAWILEKAIDAVVLAIVNASTLETIERWQFNIQCEAAGEATTRAKPLKDIQREIQLVFRQIFASVSLLPLINDPCVFEVLVYADKDVKHPLQWKESSARVIQDGELLPFRDFSTSIHKVSTLVQYKRS